jgi:DNA-binding NtrC family response regulator
MQILMTHNYAGNVRQLRNIVERAVVLSRGPVVTVEDLQPLAGQDAGESGLTELLEMPLEQAVGGLERRMVVRALERSQGNKTEAARLLGIHRQQLYAKLEELGIE